VTGGYWEQGEAEGQVRLVVTTRGYEHLWSSLMVEWIDQDDRDTAARVVRSEDPIELPGDVDR